MKNFVPAWVGRLTAKRIRMGIVFVVVILTCLGVGIGLNRLVLTSNDGHMPVALSPTLTQDPKLYVKVDGSKLVYLGDVHEMRIEERPSATLGWAYHRTVDFITGNEGPGLYYYSIGDLLIWIGRASLIPIVIIFAIFTNLMIRRAVKNGHRLFAEWRDPEIPRLVRWSVDGLAIAVLLAIELSVIYSSWVK